MRGRSSIVQLANEPPLHLGPLSLKPATREIVHADGRRDVVEPRVMRVLIALAQAEGEIVTRDGLNQSCWDGRIVGEDSISRVISLLRRLSEGLGAGVFHIDTISGIGYRLVREGEAGVDSAETVQPPGRRRWIVLTAALLLISITLAGGWRLTHPAVVAKPVPHLRIFAFTPLSPEVSPADVALTREEIVAAFGRTSWVDVDANPKGSVVSPLSWRLTGTIARAGPKLRFIVHLIHESTGTAVWSAAIDRPVVEGGVAFKRVGAAVEEIVATSLVAAAGYHAGALPDPTMALFMQWNQDTVLPVGPFRHGEEELRRAIALTPDFAGGWTALAMAVGATAAMSPDLVDAARARSEAPPIMARALALNANDPLVLMAMAKSVPLGDFLGRDVAYAKAVARPTSIAGAENSSFAVFLANVGRIGDAIHEARIGYQLDPIYPLMITRYALPLSLSGQTTQARKLLDEDLALWPDDVGANEIMVRSALWTGDYATAIAIVQADKDRLPATRKAFSAALESLRTGDVAAQAAAAGDLARLSLDFRTLEPFTVSALGALGHDLEAIAAADRLISARGPTSAVVLFDPSLASARRTPGFAALAAKIGLTDYWRRSGHAPDFCAAQDPPALCAGLKPPSR